MNIRIVQITLGAAALTIAAFLLFYAVPNWVSTPKNVSHIVLSPLFWPEVLAAAAGLFGLGLLASSFRLPKDSPPLHPPITAPFKGAARLAFMAVIMAAAVPLFAWAGMVLTCAAVFLASAFVMQTRHPFTAVASAVALPLILYAFFAHVAGVAVPQGELFRLP